MIDRAHRILKGLVCAVIAISMMGREASAAGRLERIRAKGHVTCGVVARVPGFTSFDTDGRAIGFEPDLCRAVAAAIFGSSDKAVFVPADTVIRFKQNREIDLVARRLTQTLRRDADRDIAFSPIVFYDGAALMVATASGLRDPAALAGKPICMRRGSEAAEALDRFAALQGWTYAAVASQTIAEAQAAFFNGACLAIVADQSELGAMGIGHRDETTILSPSFSKEPLALLLHDDDPRFVRIVRWTMFALIAAEELGVTAATVDMPSRDPEIRRLLGDDPGNGRSLDLDERWAAHVIKGVGNYGEIFARHLGDASPFRMERGLNAPWTSGGLLYAPPLR